MKILKVDKDKVQVELTKKDMNAFVSLCDISTQKWWQNLCDRKILSKLPSAHAVKIPQVSYVFGKDNYEKSKRIFNRGFKKMQELAKA